MVERKVDLKWQFKLGSIFYNPSNLPVDLSVKELLARYDLTMKQIVSELFRLEVGKLGWYLVNLRDCCYYYCGSDLKSVRSQLQQLGITGPDPFEA